MVRYIQGICEECSDRDTLLFQGELVSKGARPCRYCQKCGEIVEGYPSVYATVYRWWHGRWPWQTDEA